MDFNSFLSQINKLKKIPLGGIESQFKMAPELRKNFSSEDIQERNPKESAVLALFYPDKTNTTKILLMLRSNYKGVHSAQISFPGGKKEDTDNSLLETALRETKEEIGIDKKEITIIREITKTYIPPSNFWVYPFVGYTNKVPSFVSNYEVETLIEVPISDLIDDRSLGLKNLSTSYMKNIDVPCFKLNSYIVWGATAMILSEIKDLFKCLNS
ncbi:CoA pyrophosphatase [Aureibaculum marinum]|uniref:CoA pyrophosphatase n=1 Tax=Aureibaculum marinum TaxID=2487930 RepID=A0A3N4NQZ1_9FLAO|nr:CoA pyrophosphatase [Aureibaculum marinum]RPD98644.1 CoA pyrophosphatase [Aureibaculum marinum]